MAVADILAEARNRMQSSVEALRRQVATVRTGRANPALVENLLVDYYGSTTPLKQLASISVSEARLIVIQPWDRKALSSIEKAIQKSDLGLNPISDGQFLRLPIPPLTEERRRDLVKLVRKRVEEGKIALRNVRRDAVEELRRLVKNKEISEDEEERAQEQLQRLIQSFTTSVEEIGNQKETELLET